MTYATVEIRMKNAWLVATSIELKPCDVFSIFAYRLVSIVYQIFNFLDE